jgi:hypothetical protein
MKRQLGGKFGAGQGLIAQLGEELKLHRGQQDSSAIKHLAELQDAGWIAWSLHGGVLSRCSNYSPNVRAERANSA